MTNEDRRSKIVDRRTIDLRNSIFFLLFFIGCNKNPFDRTHDASNGGGTGTFTGASSFVIFNSELISGGGAFEYPGPEGQTLSFNDISNPVSHRSIRYSWTGQPVSNAGCPAQSPTSAFAGFDLMHTATQAEYAGTPGRNLTKAGYTKVTFYARGSLSTNTYLKVEIAGPGSADPCAAVVSPCVKLLNGVDPAPGTDTTCTPFQLTGQWGTYTITIPSPATQLAAVKDLFKATFIYTNLTGAPSGQGGTAYFDVIQYQP
jgi:hypothetical protein